MKKTLLGCAVVLLSIGLLSGCNNDDTINPSDIEPDPDPEIVEPGPVEDPDDGDDGEEEDLIPSSMIVTGNDDLVVYYNNDVDSRTPITLDLRDILTVMVLDQFGNEYTGPYGGSEYRLSTKSSEYITLDGEGVVTAVSEGTATVTVTSVANSSLTEDIEIEVTEREFCDVESISISLGGQTIDDENVVLDWGATSDKLEVTFNPSDATVQTYEVTSQYQYSDGLFTYDEATHTFTHTRLNTGTETFTITATDQSYSASATITLECDPVIDGPYEVVWKEESPLPETIAKGESIENLDEYVEVHYDHTGQDEHEYEDDTYTLSYVGSDGVEISGTTATFTGDGGTETYITVTATPNHALNSSVYARSSNITITQAVTDIGINYSEYVFKPLKSDTSVDLEVTFYPEDAYPLPDAQITWTVTGEDSSYIEITPDDDDDTKCTVSLTETGLELIQDNYIDGITVTGTTDDSTTFTCDIAISTYDFATDSWETIDEVSSDGIASKVYDVGDTKENVSINSEYYTIRIIDFDHDDLTDDEVNGYDDPDYNNGSNKAAITCEMVDCLSTTYNMKSSTQSGPSNSGGWNACLVRSWLNNTILSTLDGNLQSVIKKVDKMANGGAGTEIVTSSDSLFLLADAEIDSSSTGIYNNEGTIYEYWSEHDTYSEDEREYPDRIKYRNGSAIAWWTRTADNDASTTFHKFDSSGRRGADASTSYNGVSFAFCV